MNGSLYRSEYVPVIVWGEVDKVYFVVGQAVPSGFHGNIEIGRAIDDIQFLKNWFPMPREDLPGNINLQGMIN